MSNTLGHIINGVEIASLHAPPSLSWNSGASAEGNVTMLFPAVLPEGTLRPSGNVLAMHGLNRDINDDDFVLVPTLSGIGHDLSSARYFTAATPGTPNDACASAGCP